MASGGKRPGSGRPKGHKADIAKGLARAGAIKSAEEIVGTGITPLKFLIDAMRNTKLEFKLRIDAAKDAASYVHCRKPQEVILQAEVHIDGVDIAIVGKAT